MSGIFKNSPRTQKGLMVMHNNIFTETPLCGKGVSVSTREAQTMMLSNLGLWLTRFKIARAKPYLETFPMHFYDPSSRAL